MEPIMADVARKGIHFLGNFVNGKPTGAFWIGLLGGGYLHGEFDSRGHVTGSDLAFIYPDGETALVGHFEDKIMKAAHWRDVISYGCDADTGLFRVTKFSEKKSDIVFRYEPPTNISFGGGAPPGTPDPYEAKLVYTMQSSEPHGGDGVFAKKDIPSGRLVCFYSLFLYRKPIETRLFSSSCTRNITLSEDTRRECSKYSLTILNHTEIHLPPELDVPETKLANLGPKVNHHFKLHNAGYFEVEHPRWGLIQSVTSNKAIKKGDEVFTFYGYVKNSFPHDFPWYWKAKERIEQEEKLSKLAKDKNME